MKNIRAETLIGVNLKVRNGNFTVEVISAEILITHKSVYAAIKTQTDL